MTKNLRLLFAAISFFSIQSLFSQVTLISKGTEIDGGVILPNGRPILASDLGGLYTTNGTSISLITNLYNDDSTSIAIYKGEFYFTSPVTGGAENYMRQTEPVEVRML